MLKFSMKNLFIFKVDLPEDSLSLRSQPILLRSYTWESQTQWSSLYTQVLRRRQSLVLEKDWFHQWSSQCQTDSRWWSWLSLWSLSRESMSLWTLCSCRAALVLQSDLHVPMIQTQSLRAWAPYRQSSYQGVVINLCQKIVWSAAVPLQKWNSLIVNVSFAVIVSHHGFLRSWESRHGNQKSWPSHAHSWHANTSSTPVMSLGYSAKTEQILKKLWASASFARVSSLVRSATRSGFRIFHEYTARTLLNASAARNGRMSLHLIGMLK